MGTWKSATVVAALAASASIWAAGGGASTFASTFCLLSPLATTDGTTTTSYVSGSCYDWSVSPSYSGSAYADNTAATAAEPPPPAPVTPALPTWRNLYDWANGHGYAGWHTASSSQAGAYGMQTNLGGQYGLWLWPVGGTSYSYTNGNYAEFTYAAPGTTRLANATITFSYRNKLLAHHCIDVGFRTGTTIVTHNEHCVPAAPPDSQRQVVVSLVDPSTNPTSKTLYIRIRVSCGGATTCSKNIPALDPLSTGGYVRVTKADMTLVDDDKPTLQLVSDKVDTFNDTYSATVKASDAGSGVKSLQFGRDGQPPFASANAPCDPTHNTAALDNRICPQDFTLSGTLDISNLEDGTYGFTATAVDLAGNVGVMHWTVTLDRVSLEVALNPLVLAARDKYTSPTQTAEGWSASERIPSSSTRQGFKWRFDLASNQRLVALPNGGLAVVLVADTAGPDPLPEDDYSDADSISAGDSTPSSPADSANDGQDGFPTGDHPDEGDFDLGTAPPESTTNDEATDPSLGALDDAQSAVSDPVVAAVTPPKATDAAGLAVPASFAVNGNTAVLTISHQGTATGYPVTASAGLVAQGPDAAAESTPALLRYRRVLSSVDCTGRPRPKVITYDPQGSAQLLAAIETYPIECADYYVEIGSPPANPNDSLQVKYRKKRQVIAGSAQRVCAANADHRLSDVGAVVYPVAEFQWQAWRDYATSLGFANIDAAWRKAGREFRVKMQAAGYGKACPATGAIIPENWAINEFPSTLTVAKGDVTPPQVWRNTRAAASGLYSGYPDSSTATYPDTPGIAFIIDPGQARQYFKAYRDGWQTLLQQRSYWVPMSTYIRFWSQEAFTNCFKVCLLNPNGAPYNRAVRAQQVNAYTLHPALLADKGGAATASARNFLRPRYTPLLNGFWGATVDPTPDTGYGRTDQLNLDQMMGLVSLQVYANRRHATGLLGPAAETSTEHKTYPHLRVAFAWHDEPQTITVKQPDGTKIQQPNPDYQPNQVLADRIAQALQSAYSSPGYAVAACSSPDGSTYCTRSVPRDVCNPSAGLRTAFNPCWLENFSKLGWNEPPVDCVLRSC